MYLTIEYHVHRVITRLTVAQGEQPALRSPDSATAEEHAETRLTHACKAASLTFEVQVARPEICKLGSCCSSVLTREVS